MPASNPPTWSPPGGLVGLHDLRVQAAAWNLEGVGPLPQPHGAFQTSAHRVGHPDQPAWLTTGTWLDLIEELAPLVAAGPLTVQLLAGEGRYEAPAWSHLRFEALPRAHGWSLSLRRPGSHLAQLKAPLVDTAEIGSWVRRAQTEFEVDGFWRGEPLLPLPPAPRELPLWEGLVREADGTWRLGYFRQSLPWQPGDLADLVDLAWASGLSRAWLVPGPTLVFRGIPATSVDQWRTWLVKKRRITQRSPWHRVLRTVEAAREGTGPYQQLVSLLEAADEWPPSPVVLGSEETDRREGLYTPGHMLVLPTAGGWRWRSADGLYAGEGDSQALLLALHTDAPRETGTSVPGVRSAAAPQHTCQSCGNIYSPAWGDPLAAIPPGVAFDHLPGFWTCPVCGAPPSRYALSGGPDVRFEDPH